MEKTITTNDTHELFKLLKTSKLTKCDDTTKFIVIKSTRKLKGIAENYADFISDAQEKLKGKDHQEIVQLAQKWQKEGDKTTLTNDEKLRVNTYLSKYYGDINKCVEEEAKKENKIDLQELSEEQFESFIASNDFTVAQIMALEGYLCRD